MKVDLVYFIFSANFFLVSSKLNGEGKICGRTYGTGSVEEKFLAQEKIVGGFDVGYYRYSWYAALVTSNIVACGGTLIGSKTIVSAAHCFKEYIVTHDANKVKLEDVYNVSLGIYNRCQKEKSQKTFFVQKVHVHEKYKDNIPYYDISVIILKESTNSYQPICLPKGPVKNKPREGSVPGLGTLRYHGSTPCTLHEARLLTYSDLECRKMINRTGNDPKKVYRAFCAGYLQGGIDTCQGDSGGPFQIIDEFGNYILLGVVSFGFHCANPNLLGVYTDVSQYIDWIEQKSGFNATLGSENTNNITENPVIAEGHSTVPEHSPKPGKKPQVHVVHPGGMPSVNIFILTNKNAMPISEKTNFSRKMRKRKNKHIKKKIKKTS